MNIELAHKSLLGLSIGDAFGDSFFGERAMILDKIHNRELPKTTWEFTDDTVMAISIVSELAANGAIDQDSLVNRFVKNHDKDPLRGYGATVRRILREVGEGGNWKEVASAAFEGMGSMGNGAAMRITALGAFYYDDLSQLKNMTIKASEVTHTHLEAIVGALAVALAASMAAKIGLNKDYPEPNDFIKSILLELPESDTKSKIVKSLSVPYTYRIDTVESILGNGSQIMAKDTVPFSIWCAAHNLMNFEEALWKAVSILGDRDTICAIVGGITILSSKSETVPLEWMESVENYKTSLFF